MKIYLLYITIPDVEFTCYSVRNLIPNVSDYVNCGDYWMGLYAWTKDKSILKEFSNLRDMKKYRIVKKDITKEEFATFKLDYKIYQIGFYSFASDELNPKRQKLHEKEKRILSVFHENDTIMQDGDILFYDEFINEYNYDYRFFKEKYQETLDSIGYSTLFDVCLCGGYDDTLSDDVIDKRSEYASYQMSYGLTLDGREYLDLTMDKLGLYLRLYQFAF